MQSEKYLHVLVLLNLKWKQEISQKVAYVRQYKQLM